MWFSKISYLIQQNIDVLQIEFFLVLEPTVSTKIWEIYLFPSNKYMYSPQKLKSVLFKKNNYVTHSFQIDWKI